MMSDNGAVYALPTAISEGKTLLAIIADPAAAKSNLDAWAAVQARVTAEAAALDEGEKAVSAREVQANAAVKKLDAERAAHERAVSEHRGNLAELENARAALVAQQQAHALNVVSLSARSQDLDGRYAQLSEREATLAKAAEQHRLDTEAAHNAIIAREKAVVAGEAELKAKRDKLAKALQS